MLFVFVTAAAAAAAAATAAAAAARLTNQECIRSVSQTALMLACTVDNLLLACMDIHPAHYSNVCWLGTCAIFCRELSPQGFAQSLLEDRAMYQVPSFMPGREGRGLKREQWLESLGRRLKGPSQSHKHALLRRLTSCGYRRELCHKLAEQREHAVERPCCCCF